MGGNTGRSLPYEIKCCSRLGVAVAVETPTLADKVVRDQGVLVGPAGN